MFFIPPPLLSLSLPSLLSGKLNFLQLPLTLGNQILSLPLSGGPRDRGALSLTGTGPSASSVLMLLFS